MTRENVGNALGSRGSCESPFTASSRQLPPVTPILGRFWDGEPGRRRGLRREPLLALEVVVHDLYRRAGQGSPPPPRCPRRRRPGPRPPRPLRLRPPGQPPR